MIQRRPAQLGDLFHIFPDLPGATLVRRRRIVERTIAAAPPAALRRRRRIRKTGAARELKR